MQTFMTRMSYTATAEDLDDFHLGKQRLDVVDTLNQIAYEDQDLADHPLVLMWQYNALALAAYGLVICKEWTFKRGFLDTKAAEIQRIAQDLIQAGHQPGMPPWALDKDVIRSHRSNLVRMNPSRYGNLFQGIDDRLPYLWPIVDEDGTYVLLISNADKKRMNPKKKTRHLPKEMARRVENFE